MVRIDGKLIEMEIDSDASITVIIWEVFQKNFKECAIQNVLQIFYQSQGIA